MITSVQNKQVKEWKKLHKKKHRDKKQQFLIEGYHLVEEAHYSEWIIDTLIAREGVTIPTWYPPDEVEYVDERVFKEFTQTETPQGIAAVVNVKQFQLNTSFDTHTLLLDAVQDPGNLGTIIRTADAAGFQKVVLGERTVDVYNDKVIRATQGSIFHIKVVRHNLQNAINDLKKDGVTIYAAALQHAVLLNEVVPNEKVALVMGNEGAGIHPSILEQADITVKIPIHGKAESLNVSVAAGILMYQMIK